MGDIELQIFSERLKELRLSLNLTQAEFVEGLGITSSALSAYEKNLKNPSISVAKRISEKYNVSIDWLCGLSEQKNLASSYNTYGDIATELLKIDKCIDILLLEKQIDSSETYTGLFFYDSKMNSFLHEWMEASNILNNTSLDKSITRNMYDSWEKTKLDELSKKDLKKRKYRRG